MKSKKAIKELKREIAYLKDAHNAIHSFTAYQSQDIDEFKRQNETNKELIGILNEKLNSIILREDNVSELKSELEHHKSKIKELFDFTQSIARHLGYAESEIKTIAKHVQNLEAENVVAILIFKKRIKTRQRGRERAKRSILRQSLPTKCLMKSLKGF